MYRIAKIREYDVIFDAKPDTGISASRYLRLSMQPTSFKTTPLLQSKMRNRAYIPSSASTVVLMYKYP